MTLKKLGVAKGSKIMVVGSTLNDVLEVGISFEIIFPTYERIK